MIITTFIFALILMIGLAFLASFFLVRVVPWCERLRRAIFVFFLFSIACFFVGLTSANLITTLEFFQMISLIYTFGAWMFGAILIILVHGCILWIFTRIFRNFCKNSSVQILLIVILVGSCALGVYNSLTPRVVEYNIEIPGEHAWHGRTIALVADMHYGAILAENSARKLIRELEVLHPDIVLFVGDFFDGGMMDYDAMVHTFDTLDIPNGILFTDGNHEEYRHTFAIDASFQDSNIRNITNSGIVIDGMLFAGVGYRDSHDIEGLESTLGGIFAKIPEKNLPTILMKHEPSLHDTIAEHGIDLVVSGHTHRGQLYFFEPFAWWRYGEYVYGEVIKDGLTSITTSGFGTWGPPERLGSQSEIVLIRIK